MSARAVLSIGNFLSATHFYLVVYVIAPFLATFMPQDQTGLVISAGALFTLFLLPVTPRIVPLVGARTLALVFGVFEALALVMLSFEHSSLWAIIFAALAFGTSPLIAYCLDLLLEATVAEESSTGHIRTFFLTAGNLALLVAPVAISMLLDDSEAYYRVFLAAALSLVPFLILFSVAKLPQGRPLRKALLRDTLSCVVKDTDLSGVLFANALLQFFYHLAPFYIPLYLHTILGIPWNTLGWMFVVMLSPFVLLELPAGNASDAKKSDKFILAGGFLTMSLSFALIGLVQEATPLLVVLILLVGSRVGAALVEAITESHFFRRVSEADTNTISMFRAMRPLAALIAPLTGSALLALFGYEWLFITTGALLAAGGVFATIRLSRAYLPGS